MQDPKTEAANIVTLEGRQRSTENVVVGVTGSVGGHRWILSPLSIGAVVIVGIAVAVGGLKLSTASHDQGTAECKAQLAADIARLEKIIFERLARVEKHDALEINRLDMQQVTATARLERTLLAALAQAEKRQVEEFARVENQHAAEVARIEKLKANLSCPIGIAHKPASVSNTNRYHERVGKLARLTDDSITVDQPLDPGKAEYTYPLAVGARVLVKGEGAKLDDLKPGMTLRILYAGGQKIQLIETVEEE